MRSAISKAIKVAGGRAQLARAICVTQQAVYLWTRGGRVDPENVLAIVKATNGAVTPHALRPDVYPDPNWMPMGVVGKAQKTSLPANNHKNGKAARSRTEVIAEALDVFACKGVRGG